MKNCQFCHKSRLKVAKRKKLRGNYNPVNVYFQKANLQPLNWQGKKLLVCKDCRKLILKGIKTV